jgi:hypothetical protein
MLDCATLNHICTSMFNDVSDAMTVYSPSTPHLLTLSSSYRPRACRIYFSAIFLAVMFCFIAHVLHAWHAWHAWHACVLGREFPTWGFPIPGFAAWTEVSACVVAGDMCHNQH